ncbi:hypothetical protein FEM48_Zijuj07G0157300 [Ziziphus jujuba var. spinosa]|uniref:Uncharacterized protein n=1 Tax=Ziziphus jujuba var. spinosa TaxID=714518 RepID=A0A978V5I0_ZIZJJ|nr:hypothetical protein FEM48_Zijuj07G0157300 [Ziziphus jujuba var. spinosa]
MGKKIEVAWAKNTEFEVWEERELKRRREKEREASRLALEQVERSVVGLFDDNLQAEIEISIMCRSSPYYRVFGRNPLNGLGLFLKRDDDDHDHDHEEVVEVHQIANNNNNNTHNGGQIISNGCCHDHTSSFSVLPLSRRKAKTDRISMLKSRFMDVISKSQQQLGLLHLNKQNQLLMTKKDATFKRSSTRHYFKTKPRINALIPGGNDHGFSLYGILSVFEVVDV